MGQHLPSAMVWFSDRIQSKEKQTKKVIVSLLVQKNFNMCCSLTWLNQTPMILLVMSTTGRIGPRLPQFFRASVANIYRHFTWQNSWSGCQNVRNHPDDSIQITQVYACTVHRFLIGSCFCPKLQLPTQLDLLPFDTWWKPEWPSLKKTRRLGSSRGLQASTTLRFHLSLRFFKTSRWGYQIMEVAATTACLSLSLHSLFPSMMFSHFLSAVGETKDILH